MGDEGHNLSEDEVSGKTVRELKGAGWQPGFFTSDANMRVLGARLVERGELPLLVDPDSDGATDLPLCFVDYAMVERRGGGRSLSVDAVAWGDACRLVGMHAVIFGIAEGIDDGDLERQYTAWVRRGANTPKS